MTTENVKSGVTPAQREWVKKLGSLAGATGRGGATPDVVTSRLQPGDAPGTTRSLFDPSDIPGLLIKTLTGPHSNVCRINNNTDVPLRLDPQSSKEVDNEAQIGLSHGKFDSFIPDPIAPGSSGEFKASSNTVLGQTLTGVEGRVRYFLDDQGTSWVFHHNNPFKGSNKADAQIFGPNKDKFTTPKPIPGGGDDAVFLFAINQVGGGTTPPGPKPVPTTDVKSSCLITVTNNTKQVLTLLDQGHARGDFMTFPSSTLQPGAASTFASVETPNAKEQGCKGFLIWEVGSPKAATWRVDWDNPEQQKNTTATKLDPESAGFRALDQIGQGEDNVPVAFTLSGGPGGPGPGPVPPGPVPPGPVPPGPEPEFNPPVEARQPTLRKGDKSKDGWVEYLQQLLNNHLKTNLELDGDFGSGTLKAVLAFQVKKELQKDGIVGNQTWAALREGQPEKPSTDGRQPHTFVERGAEARWDTENQNAVYLPDFDELLMFVTSVGDTRIDDFQATVRVTPPGGKASVVKVTIGRPTRELPSGAGHNHVVKLPNFKKTFPPPSPEVKVTDYKLEAFLDAKLGGDLWRGKIVDK